MIPCSKPSLGIEELIAVKRVMDSNVFINGIEVRAFEDEFASFTGADYAVAVSNCTVALQLTLEMLGIGPGDHVIVPKITAWPTVEAVYNVGATPVPVNVESLFYTVIPEEIEVMLEKDEFIKAIIPVHLFGQPADMLNIMKLVNSYGIAVIEDCAQAVGSCVAGKHVGVFGDAGCFSFYPTKNMTCGGDGGMIITNNKDLAQALKLKRNHCIHGDTSNHIGIGYNYRMGEIAAAIGRAQLHKLTKFNMIREDIAREYNARLQEWNYYLSTPTYHQVSGFLHSYHQYVISIPYTYVDHRDFIVKSMKNNFGIQCGIHYPYHIGDTKDKPIIYNDHWFSKSCISLPMHVGLEIRDVQYICNSLITILEKIGVKDGNEE